MTGDSDQAMVRRVRQLGPQEIREAAFGAARRRRGLDPDEVRAFLGQVADEVDRLQQELAAATGEVIRVKTALHNWQVEHAATCAAPQTGRPAGAPAPQQPAPSPQYPAPPYRPETLANGWLTTPPR
jgi:DivIVA domain-containing protein